MYDLFGQWSTNKHLQQYIEINTKTIVAGAHKVAIKCKSEGFYQNNSETEVTSSKSAMPNKRPKTQMYETDNIFFLLKWL